MSNKKMLNMVKDAKLLWLGRRYDPYETYYSKPR